MPGLMYVCILHIILDRYFYTRRCATDCMLSAALLLRSDLGRCTGGGTDLWSMSYRLNLDVFSIKKGVRSTL